MSTQPAYDRLGNLLSGQTPPTYNGIDFVEVAGSDQTQLRVHFLNSAAIKGTFTATPPVTVCSETAGAIPVLPIDETKAWSADQDGRPVLSIAVVTPGDASIYTLNVSSSALDPYFDQATFSFEASNPTALDCQAPTPVLPAPESDAPPINYLAKDFGTFTQSLSDFSALRYPAWVERSEADFGVMMMEALSAIADELSYLQDRVAAEATLGSATQRVSLMRHARLVDYDPSPAIAATTALQVDVAAAVTALQSGLRCSATGPDGQRIAFELGAGLADPGTGELLSAAYLVDPRWNAHAPVGGGWNLEPYWWDTSQQCLPVGSTRLWVIGHGHGFAPGQQLLIDTAGADSADPPVREIVILETVTEITDPVFKVDLTQIDLQAPTQYEHDLGQTHLAGNLLPAMHGTRASETFAIPSGVVVRNAANWTPDDPRPDYRYTLAAAQISWLADAASGYLPALAPPSDLMAEASATGGSLATGQYAYQVTAVNTNGETTALTPVSVAVTGPTGSVTLRWGSVLANATYNVYGRAAGAVGKLATVGPFSGQQQASYTDTGTPPLVEDDSPPSANTTAGPAPSTADTDLTAEVAAVPQIALVSTDPSTAWRWERWLLGSGPADSVFTLTPESYVAVGGSRSRTWFDYAGEGTTLRFGDGTFGLTPTIGTIFVATYLTGGGVVGNVPADTIVQVEPGDPQAALVETVTNPFAATGGADEETAQQIRDRAPQAFQANPLRVVRDSDYVAAAESLPWVIQAGTSFRWTGSWLTAFTTADPMASEGLDVGELEQLSDLLNRRRLAGYESYVLAPSYASIDLEITVSVQPGALAETVQAAVITALSPGALADGTRGFFDHQRWSFGQPLESSALLAAIQHVPGVVGVSSVLYRRHAVPSTLLPLPETVPVPPDQILRMDNDPGNAQNGSLHVIVEASP